MVDRVTMRDTGSGPFDKHPGGAFTAVCVDVIALGSAVETFQGKDPRVKEKVALVFATGEIGPTSGQPLYANAEFTLSGHAKANLRKQLEAWRGRPYTEAEIRAGFQLEKLVGMACTVTVQQITTAQGKLFSKVIGLAPVMKGAVPPDHSTYKRDDFWEVRKAKYAAGVEDYYRTLNGGQALPPVPRVQAKAASGATPAPNVAQAGSQAQTGGILSLRDELEAMSSEDEDEADESLPF